MTEDFLYYIIGAAVIIIIAAYWYLKTNNLSILPQSIQDDIEKLKTENTEALAQLETLVNLKKLMSISNITSIIEKANSMKSGGYTDEELKELGKFVMDKLK